MTTYVYVYRGGAMDGKIVAQDHPVPDGDELVSESRPNYVLVRHPQTGEQYMMGRESEVLDDGRTARVLRIWLLE